MENQEQICKVVNLSNNDILPNRFQPRKYFDEEDILQLSESIKEHGVINPIIVRKLGDKYELVAGERRYKANILAGNDSIPAIIMDVNDKESSEIAVVENIQRRDLNAIEEAISYKRILDIGYMTQEQLAQKMGKSQSAIANKIRLLKLSDDVQDALMKKQISERHARSLLKLSSQQKQNEMLNRIIQERLTVRKTDEEIDKMNNNMYENSSDSLAPIMPDSTITDVNISAIPNYNNNVTTIPTEPMSINNQVDNAMTKVQSNPVAESQNIPPQQAGSDISQLNPINDIVTPIHPNPVFVPQNEQSQSVVPDIPSLNSIVDNNDSADANGGIIPSSNSVVEPQAIQSQSSVPNIPPLNPINDIVSPIHPNPIFVPQNEQSQSVVPDIPSLNSIVDNNDSADANGGIIPSTNSVVEPQTIQSQSPVPNIPPLNPINDIVTSVQSNQVTESQNTPSQSIGLDISQLNPINDIVTPIHPNPVVQSQNNIPNQINTYNINNSEQNNFNDNLMGNNILPNNENKNNYKESQKNDTLSFATSPIIDTTINNQVSDLSELNDLDSNINNNSSIPPISNNQFEQVPEPIIVNDYNQQYDPIMPEVQNQNPTIDFKTIINLIRKCSTAIENSGYKIETEEYNLDNLYQVVFKIEKK